MSAQRVFHPLLIRLAVVALVPTIVVAALFGSVIGIVSGVVALAFDLRNVRRQVIAGMPDEMEFVASRPTEHDWLDDERFRQELLELAGLGFHAVGDFTVRYPGAPDGFGHLLVNPAHDVYAEVNQLRHGATVLPVATTLISALSDDWSLQTSARVVLPVQYAFMRAPRALWRSVVNASPDALLDDHRSLRESMCRDLSLTVLGAGTMDDYFDLQRKDHRSRTKTLRRTNVITSIARGLACERRQRTEWLGDYTRSQA